MKVEEKLYPAQAVKNFVRRTPGRTTSKERKRQLDPQDLCGLRRNTRRKTLRVPLTALFATYGPSADVGLRNGPQTDLALTHYNATLSI